MYANRFLSLRLLLFLPFPARGSLNPLPSGTPWSNPNAGDQRGFPSEPQTAETVGLSVQQSSGYSPLISSLYSETMLSPPTASADPDPCIRAGFSSPITASSPNWGAAQLGQEAVLGELPRAASPTTARVVCRSWLRNGLLIRRCGGFGRRDAMHSVPVFLAEERQISRETKHDTFAWEGFLNARMGATRSCDRTCRGAPLRLSPNLRPDLRASWALVLVRTLVRVLEFFVLQILFLIALLSLLLLALLLLKGVEWFLGLSVVDLEFSAGGSREASLSSVREDADQDLLTRAAGEQDFLCHSDQAEAAVFTGTGTFV